MVRRFCTQENALPSGRWTHVAAVVDPAAGGCRLYVDGKLVADGTGALVRDEAAYVSQMYHLQRFITACAGRGAYPIKFNGTLFTVPPGPTEKDPDYRRWGPGYWWQNTRLPYISLCTSGDFDLQRPLFRMYADELLPLCKYRTKLYLGHDGAYYPECIMFWGAVFSETYGWTPFEQRKDKLQESGWHKWEWVGGLELCWMMLDYYDHTLDRSFLRSTALPFAREILTFFEQHYPTNAQGKLVMHPSQAVETWWHCTNAMPELAGCIAVTERLLALPEELGSSSDREFWQRLRAKLPPIPLRDVKGRKALAPADFLREQEQYREPGALPGVPVPALRVQPAECRLGVGRAGASLGSRSQRLAPGRHLHGLPRADGRRAQRLSSAAPAATTVASGSPPSGGRTTTGRRIRTMAACLMKAFQSMLLQTDGKQIFLLPAWPKDWDVEFKLHAPQQTVIEGIYRDGKLASLRVTPEARRRDLVIGGK